jgi:hypothetical protein
VDAGKSVMQDNAPRLRRCKKTSGATHEYQSEYLSAGHECLYTALIKSYTAQKLIRNLCASYRVLTVAAQSQHSGPYNPTGVTGRRTTKTFSRVLDHRGGAARSGVRVAAASSVKHGSTLSGLRTT